MGQRRARAMLAVALALYAATATAALAQRPGARERELADLIRAAGFDCLAVEAIELAPAPQPGFDSFRPEVVVCRNGQRFLVAKSGRSGGNLPPVVRRLPAGQ